MRVIGHRGACGYEQENSLRSLIRAVEIGADGVEFDVRLTADHVPVLIHDEDLERTTSHSGRVGSISLTALRQRCDSNSVPTLDEAIHAISSALRSAKSPDDLMVNVELKEYEAVEPTRTVLLQAMDRTKLINEQILITSFDHSALVRYRTLSHNDTTKFNIGLLSKGLPTANFWELAAELKATSANIDLGSVNSSFVATAHSQGMSVMVYTVNDPTDAHRMRELGVDAIFSDFPDRVSQ